MTIARARDYFGEKISRFLKTSGISQRKLAKQMKCDHTTISRRASGVVIPEMNELVQIAWYSDTPFTYFFDDAKQLSTVTSNSAHQTMDSSVDSQEEASGHPASRGLQMLMSQFHRGV